MRAHIHASVYVYVSVCLRAWVHLRVLCVGICCMHAHLSVSESVLCLVRVCVRCARVCMCICVCVNTTPAIIARRPEPVPISRTNESGLITLRVWEIVLYKVLRLGTIGTFQNRPGKSAHAKLNYTANRPSAGPCNKSHCVVYR